jgi:outer membrane protein OmpA-like peptidoglycan-associated protein/Tol biopolymer transport system component
MGILSADPQIHQCALKSLPLKYLVLILFICALPPASFGQRDQSHINKKAEQLYSQGLQKATEGDINGGIVLLKNAINIEKNFPEALLSLGGMYAELKNYTASVEYYEKTKALDNNYFKDYLLPYSISVAGLGQFEKALDAVYQFLKIPDLNVSSRLAGEYRKKCFEFAVDYAKQRSLAGYRFEPANMGDSINSAVSEYFPALTIEGKKLFYTRRVNNNNEDFYEAEKNTTSWSKSKSLQGDINTDRNEGAQNISQDGEWLIFTGCDFSDGYGSCDLYISYLTTQGWSKPENLGQGVNTEAWESAPSLSPDKRDLYFASTRTGGFGKSDIYVTHRQPNGHWSEPENAGPRINTPGNESCPFIHADNQTLYFTSDGHAGYGGDDLFLIKKNGDKWDSAQNLGYPINTIENEGSLVVEADGKTAYYASDRSDSRGGLDLYTFELREDIRPLRTLWVKGKVYDAKTKKGLPSAVELTDLSSKVLLSRVQTDETGNYLITLPVGRDYAFNVSRRGYLFFSDNFSLTNNVADSTYHIDIPLQPLEADATVVLKNIFFDVNRYELKPQSFTELDNIIGLLKENPSLKISINGHTDNSGKAEDNLRLSDSRSKSVVQYLITKGIDQKRLAYKGYGSTQPVADNATEAGRAMNRRTEMKVVN